jgi:MSHA biogenesis protein MshO
MRAAPDTFCPSPKPAGFTLVELIVVIVISGILAAIVGVFILRPVQGYNAQVRRAEMVDAAESALRRMQRDIRAALPNSVRIRTNGVTVDDVTCPNGPDTVCVIELLHTVDGGRYRAGPGPGAGASCNLFEFAVNERSFDVIGTLQNFAAIDPTNHWLVINNQTTLGTGFNAYFGDNRTQLSPNGTDVGGNPCAPTSATHVDLVTKNFAATLASPRQRFYIVDTPVTFRCEPGAGSLTRYQGYAITAAQAVTPAGGSSAAVASLVSGCRFTYSPGTSQRAGVVTLELTITDPNVNGQSESVRLLHQVHVYNVP